MTHSSIQRQYNEVIAEHYDFDSQGVTAAALDRAFAQLCRQPAVVDPAAPLRVLDLGMGTGLFLARLATLAGDRFVPSGLDLSEKMTDQARRRVPGLTAVVDTAANLDAHFPGEEFDVVCTHFITGFVPMATLAPKIHAKLAAGGCWSFVGGTMAGFPGLRAWSDSRLVWWLSGGGGPAVDEMVTNPAGADEVARTLEANGFVVRACETFEPTVEFADYDGFLTFAYRGGWLTPFVERYRLHKVGRLTRALVNRVVFPMTDHHNIVIAVAEKTR